MAAINFAGLPPPLRRRRRVPRQVAVALGYDPTAGRGAPEVLASGVGLMAGRILERARASGVPVHEDADLAEVLGSLPVGADIPPELYEAVAEVLAFIYRMNGSYVPGRR
ncbi:MAG TPA: EscU/YscU/HrcU family type III secretion system export apparatus switch protein [Planctomycetota bacterium]|nr:EscU/YscU/HrcU family type III secretion system export apparatus switch protein [Planctomycetota bacterium]